jgi:hypothetical protein
MRPFLLSLAILLVLPGVAAADDAVVSYAIVVGSNAGGPGQDDLRFAERDAKRVATVLKELGGYEAGNVHTVLEPTPGKLLDAVAAVAAQVTDDSAAGRRSLVFFYYSGHARATGLVLGDDELALDDLRAKLTALPATLTIVVLDACQSGAFSRVKGAEAAADFSFNSRTGLDAAGIAVLASSSASELSQESDFLEGSYFTHHLLVGLRGGGDENKDGRVSLDEAYQYAYHQTLLATAQTAVGGQHVSLEVDLKGQGEVPLTFPDQADATLRLAADIAGDVLVERQPAEAVLAEVHKEAGATFDVAVPAGKYRVLIREAKVVRRCPITVPSGGSATVELSGCDELALVETGSKGGEAAPHRWTFSIGLGLGGVVDDSFTRHLDDSFEYRREGGRAAFTLDSAREVFPHVLAVARLTHISGETWKRDITNFDPLTFHVESDALTVGARGTLGDGALIGWAEAGGGITWSRARFTDEERMSRTESHFGAHLMAGVGGDWSPHWMGRFGLEVAARWMYAPTVDNDIDDTMDVGGLFVGLGLTYRYAP